MMLENLVFAENLVFPNPWKTRGEQVASRGNPSEINGLCRLGPSGHRRAFLALIIMRLNYAGDPYCRRYLAAPKMFQDEAAFQAILEFVTADAPFMLDHGGKSRTGEVFKMAVLQTTGDWQWLVNLISFPGLAPT